MNGRRYAVATSAALGLTMLLSPRVEAENCWMIGCVGDVGYVFLPGRVVPAGGPRNYTMFRHACTDAGERKPFGTTSLPDVNAIVTIKADLTPLLEQDEIERNLGSFQNPTLEEDPEGGGCKSVWRPPYGFGSPMKAGAKVKILGYRIFLNEIVRSGDDGTSTSREQILFAMVLVESDL